MRPRDRKLANKLAFGLNKYAEQVRPLPGLVEASAQEVLVEQLLDSVHRVEYVKRLTERQPSACRADPNDYRFDPLKAAVLHLQDGNTDEAFWLVFLSTHFGKHSTGGWRYLREVYGRLGSGRWDWAAISANVDEFRDWLSDHKEELERKDSPGGFGNHRKYESLAGWSKYGTGIVVASYVEWVLSAGGHAQLISRVANANSRIAAFDELYRSMRRRVVRFRRLGCFDYLTMLGKIGLAEIEPGSAYLQGSTGPLAGARTLFRCTEKQKTSELEAWLTELGRELGVGMQVIEDALCNWQKSPTVYRRFRD